MSCCEVCGKTEQLKTCAKCLRANYCCREHQIEHWQIHKEWCDTLANDVQTSNNIEQNCQASQQQQHQLQMNSVIDDPSYYSQLESSSNHVGYIQQQQQPPPQIQHQQQLQQLQQPQQLLQPDQMMTNSYIPEPVTQFQGFNDGSYQPTENQTTYQPQQQVVQQPQLEMLLPHQLDQQQQQQQPHQEQSQCQSTQQQVMEPETSMNSHLMSAQFNSLRDFVLQNLNRYCEIILNDMNQYGFCVIDNFLQNGDQILNEVFSLYHCGVFRNGQVVNNKGTPDAKLIRGDQIAWVEGSEPMCNNIGFLIRILDSIVSRCNTSRLGQFSRYNVNRRTKAMIACYPGNSTKYVRHIDNPNRDGRCITSIYYLNKDYDRHRHGGLLRLFPQMNNSIVADVEPKFNRVIFFWSDRRNPHEVMPSARMRFAITVWYFDESERSQAVENNKQKYPQYPNDKMLVPF